MEQTFADRLNILMKDQGVSAYKMSKDLAITQSTISNYKKGKTVPGRLIMALIADYFNTTLMWLQTGAADMDEFIKIKAAQHVEDYVREVSNGPEGVLLLTLRNDSMECESNESIPENSILYYKNLDKKFLSTPLNINDFRYWIIELKGPKKILVRQIIKHDRERNTILCSALNKSPEYQDFTLSLNDVKRLGYIVEVKYKLSPEDYWKITE